MFKKKLLDKSASICGFRFRHFYHLIPEYFEKLIKLYQQNKLSVKIDRNNRDGKTFNGIASIVDAIEVSVRLLFADDYFSQIVISIWTVRLIKICFFFLLIFSSIFSLAKISAKLLRNYREKNRCFSSDFSWKRSLWYRLIDSRHLEANLFRINYCNQKIEWNYS